MRPSAWLANITLALVVSTSACKFSSAGLSPIEPSLDASGDGSLVDARLDGRMADAAPDASTCGSLAQACCASSRCNGDLVCSDDRCQCIGKLSLGANHSCALKGSSTVLCWGKNDSAQIGDGMSPADRTLPTPVPGLSNLRDVSAGVSHTCAVEKDGSVWCWGSNSFGELGNATPSPGLMPTKVGLPTGVSAIAVSAGDQFTCALANDGNVWCWGTNQFGQLGNSGADMQPHAQPVPVANVTGAVDISAGDRHACARTNAGTLFCWGLDNYGQLGNAGPESTGVLPALVALPAGRQATAIVAGFVSSCAVLDDGKLACWGFDQEGELGNGAPADTLRHATPIVISLPGGRMAASIDADLTTTCAVATDSSVWCWGNDDHGQLGNGLRESSNVPLRVTSLPGAVRAAQVAVGHQHTCARLDDATVRCWGNNDHGQIGAGPSPVIADSPTVTPLSCN